MRSAAFLDRDGTIIEDCSYLADPERIRFLPGALDGLRRLLRAGLPLVVVTNQSGLARGRISQAALEAVRSAFCRELEANGVELAGYYECPHAPWDACECRKPLPGLILAAAADLGLDPRSSFMIGNGAADVEAGRAAGCRTVLLGETAPGVASEHDFAAAAWRDAVAYILSATCRVLR